MNNLFKNISLPLIARIILGFVFIYASYSKILDPAGFSDNIHNFHVTPIWIENLAALIIPWLELILGLCLIFRVFLEGATGLIIGMLLFFIAILAQAVIRGIDVHCGCFKTQADAGVTNLRMELIKRIVEDFFFLGLAFFINFKIRITQSIKETV